MREDIVDLVTGIGQDATGPMLELRRADGTKHSGPIGREIAWQITDARHCIGYRAPGSEHLSPCPEARVTGRSAQCDVCLERAFVLPCLRCTGLRCSNPERREHCVQENNHALYLAAFAPGVIKVGVARWGRRMVRVLEQGARAALIVARDDGQLIRRLESTITRFGAADRLSLPERLTAWCEPYDAADLMAELETFLARTRTRLVDAPWLTTPEPVPVEPAAPLAYRPQVIRPAHGMVIGGAVTHTLGQTVILERDNDLLALDLPALIGYPIAAAAADTPLVTQMALGI